MKFISNHVNEDNGKKSLFTNAPILFFLAWLQSTYCFMLEWINIMILYSSTNVEGVLIHFVALAIIVEVNEQYYKNVIVPDRSNNLIKVFNKKNNPEVLWRRDIDP